MLCCIIRYFEITENKNMYDLYKESRNLFIKKNEKGKLSLVNFAGIREIDVFNLLIKFIVNITKTDKSNKDVLRKTINLFIFEIIPNNVKNWNINKWRDNLTKIHELI